MLEDRCWGHWGFIVHVSAVLLQLFCVLSFLLFMEKTFKADLFCNGFLWDFLKIKYLDLGSMCLLK